MGGGGEGEDTRVPTSLDRQRWSLLHLEELGLSRDPEIFFILLLFLLLPLVLLWLLDVLAWPAAAAMAADEEECEDDEQRQPQDDRQAHGVEDAFLVFGQDDVPDRAEEGADSPHGARLLYGQRTHNSPVSPGLQRTQIRRFSPLPGLGLGMPPRASLGRRTGLG